MKNILIVALLVIGIGVAGFFIFNNTLKGNGFQYSFDLSAPFCFGNCDVSEEEAVFIQEVEQQEENDALPPVIGGSYELYTPEKVALAEGKDIVIFFKASWCPSCRLLDAHIKANRDRIPENVRILEVDYDREDALKRAYGVTVQHTLVLVSADGDLRKKWTGGSTLESILTEISS